MTQKKNNLKTTHGKRTAHRLIKIAWKLFTIKGYENTSMENIVLEAGVTRGALYHHFKGKKGLFFAVFEKAQEEISSRVEIAMENESDNWEKLLTGTKTWLKLAIDPELQQIILIDAPSILGWNVWRTVDEQKSGQSLKKALEKLIEDKTIKPFPVVALKHIISGASNEAVLWLMKNKNPKKAFREAWFTIGTVLDSIRIEPKV